LACRAAREERGRGSEAHDARGNVPKRVGPAVVGPRAVVVVRGGGEDLYAAQLSRRKAGHVSVNERARDHLDEHSALLLVLGDDDFLRRGLGRVARGRELEPPCRQVVEEEIAGAVGARGLVAATEASAVPFL